MAQKLYKAPKKKIAAENGNASQPRRIVLVGTYKDRQLAWIKKNGVYNYPVKDGDEFAADAFARIKELWLYADTKGRRSCFAAEFIGKMSRDEFLAAYPTYANLARATPKPPQAPSREISLLVKTENQEYCVFKTAFNRKAA